MPHEDGVTANVHPEERFNHTADLILLPHSENACAPVTAVLLSTAAAKSALQTPIRMQFRKRASL